MGTMLIENDLNYQEGLWAGKKIIPNISATTYGTLEEAIRIKSELVSEFETRFGYSRNDQEFPDRNYSFNCGFLDALKNNNDGK